MHSIRHNEQLWAQLLVIFYFSPLTVFYNVIKSRNSIFLHPGLSISSFINAVVWTIYGIVIADWMLAGPNAVGVVLSFIQILLLVLYPRRPLVNDSDTMNTNTVDSATLNTSPSVKDYEKSSEKGGGMMA
jgi:uncharacterized protein with PQ loop repeat